MSSEIKTAQASSTPLIEVKGLSKSFGSMQVLKDVDLTVNQGDRIAIIGGSGCGKSVFLRCLELLEKPDSGQIFIDGQEITAKGANIDKIRQSMGMVYQKFYLFSHMDVMDNLCLAPVKLLGMKRKDAEEKAMGLLRQVGLANRAHSFPAVLSGGQQQRIAICRSLMMEPKVLLFDEPTSALDPTMVGEVLAVIRMLAKHSLTMLIVTHEMNFAREVASRVLFFAEHGIYEQGTPEEIFDHPQKPLTVDFINKIKYFSYEIKNREFDLMEFQGGICTFGEKYGLKTNNINRLQICCEELIYELLNNCYDSQDEVSLKIDISYAEATKEIQVLLVCGGKEYNPFIIEETDADSAEDNIHLGITIVKQLAKKHEFSFVSGQNRIEIVL